MSVELTDLQRELQEKDAIIKMLKDALNNYKFCPDHIVFKKCHKNTSCGDCILEKYHANKENS